ncbi:hypothetical protein [Anaerococcus nagyae]|uniref:hypothetical protein n=1 Tax=Anaerococcus nagyae TaxID=1755241 RepID=UPI003735F015
MDLDVLSGERLVDPKKFLDYIMSQTNDNDKFYILLDEVQLLKSFEQVLNDFCVKIILMFMLLGVILDSYLKMS